MKEITSIYTLRITEIYKKKDNTIDEFLEKAKKADTKNYICSIIKNRLMVDDVKNLGQKIFVADLKNRETMKELTLETIVRVTDSAKANDDDVDAIIIAEKDVNWQRAKAKDIAEKLNVDDVIFMPEVKHFINDCEELKEESKRGKSRKKKSGAA